VKREADYRDCDADALQRASPPAKVCRNQNYERNSVTPDCPIKGFEMIIEIFEP
jgi:hypothetical protein